MKNLKLVRTGLMAASAAMLMACNGQKAETAAPAAAASGDLKIAYVEIDSLMSQYQFCKDYTLLLTRKGENARATLNQKAKNLEADAQDFQRKLQNNAYTQERAQQENNRLVKAQQDLQELQERLAMELDQETASYNNALRDSLQSFLKAFNKDKGFKMILSKAGDNMLLADPAMDITKEVVEGLNKAYKPSKELENAGSAGTEEAK
ncbi:MAG: OmpH family outer membrane protein [Bacteroidaceae bacterium]|nr:OmpH family outer membrane protein [Bacteroidaceae bacterium]